MSYRLGVDVGGTFTDLILVNGQTGDVHSAKVPSTPSDPSIGVLNGIGRICQNAGIDPNEITHVMHGTTVATNTILTHTGARVGLVTTKGYRQVLQIARSFVPGGLGGWVIYNKPPPLAPLSLTIEADERIGARGEVVTKLNRAKLTKDLKALRKKGIESLTVSLINSFANPAHEQEIAAIAAEVLPDIPVSLSSVIVPEMQEYERTATTVANAYVAPKVAKYVRNLQRELKKEMKRVQLRVLRSDGGLASAKAAEDYPVNMLMSGPAGGVSGAMWTGKQAGYKNILTFDMGGTSTDVALIQDGQAQLRRETSVHEVVVRASSIDVRTVGAGGGSIAYVPEITGALRVGPQSAGADPGPAAYDKGGDEPTVTDANVVLGFLPSGEVRLGGDMVIRRDLAEAAVGKVAKALKLSVKEAAAGIIDIVNENMYGALRLVSVEKGYDPRDFALMGFGGAGPLHANALGKLSQAWPVIIPGSPGVLCAVGDATTSVRDEFARTFIRGFSETNAREVAKILNQLINSAARSLDRDGIARNEQKHTFQADVRYRGQGFLLTVDFSLDELEKQGLDVIGRQFDEVHTQLFTFALQEEKEIVNLRAVAQGKPAAVRATSLDKGGSDPSAALLGEHLMFVDGKDRKARLYDRSRLLAGNVVRGPAVILQMDTTTVILPDHVGRVDEFGNIVITPE
ncbi:MAG: hydantoinase/oxoprolinase family protein [Gammaproteobacteria bacterium]|nr:hydantoinase/oxoprolinase family protein [Gammaproteobacteria bacterium]